MKIKHWIAIVCALIGALGAVIAAIILANGGGTIDGPGESTTNQGTPIESTASSTETSIEDDSEHNSVNSSATVQSTTTAPIKSESSDTTTTTETNSTISLEANYDLKKYINAEITGSNISIKVRKDLSAIVNGASEFPFSWGISLGSSVEEEKRGYKYIDLKITIDKNYEVIETKMLIYEKLEKGVLLIDECENIISTTYDGKYYYIEGDIFNQYVDLDNVWICSTYYSND